ncbi:hypothetical protein AX17_003319 [Amanita inopinata Kibby_2008]|nr:hypothetical protein AX17_003319 [Amanita inopinata Kibby_2008]
MAAFTRLFSRQINSTLNANCGIRLYPRFAQYSRSPPTLSFLRASTLRRSVIPSLIVAGSVGLGTAAFLKQTIHCDAPQQLSVPAAREEYPPPPTSSVSLYQLSFGTVAGLCTGVFIKKGAKAVAWFLGGIFVLLQYLASTSLVRVNWARIGTRFEELTYARDAHSDKKPRTVVSLWYSLLDFLTADFQPRASFLAGLLLGLRIG